MKASCAVVIAPKLLATTPLRIAGYPAVRRPGFLAAHPVGIARLLPAGSTACGDSQSAIIGVLDGQAPTTAGALLLLARHEAGLSQRELAERAGVTQSEIARIESGKREPSIPTIQRILAGAGLELRFRLAALDEHDRVLADRQARRSPTERGAADARHCGNLKKFAANVRQRAGGLTAFLTLVVVGTCAMSPVLLASCTDRESPRATTGSVARLDCAGQLRGCGYGPGDAEALAHGSWYASPPAPLKPRFREATVWTGRVLLVWGGDGGTTFDDGAAYDPFSNSWRMMPPAPLSPRADVSAVWAGDRAIFWGGDAFSRLNQAGFFVPLSDGASYDPSTNSWHRLPQSPLSARAGASMIWTGLEVIVFGGHQLGDGSAAGATYQPASNRWSRLPRFPGAPACVPDPATVVWTGHQLLVWQSHETLRLLPAGSGVSDTFHEVAASWSPGSSSWRRIPTSPYVFPLGVDATWIGGKVVFFGHGECLHSTSCGGGPPESGATYDPQKGTYGRIASLPVGTGTVVSAAWTGKALAGIAPYMGPPGSNATLQTAAYDPTSNSWSYLPEAPLGPGYAHGFTAWTGDRLLIGAFSPAASAINSVATLTPGAG